VEAREISYNEINSVRIINSDNLVYDLEVEHNHSFCITNENIIVHNSGKSAKQVLTKNGISAKEVQVTGGDKIARAHMATPYAERGSVFCRASILEFLYTCEKQGILKFPNNEHDDLQDALVQAIQRIFNKPTMFVL